MQSQGIEIEYPVWEWILDKKYTHRVVEYSGNEREESYVGLGPTRSTASLQEQRPRLAISKWAQPMPFERRGGMIGVSRYNFRIKNNLDEPIAYLFEFYIHRGLLEVNGIRSDHTLHAGVETMIEDVLLSARWPVWRALRRDQRSAVYLLRRCPGFDSKLTHSDNANVTLIERNDFTLKYVST